MTATAKKRKTNKKPVVVDPTLLSLVESREWHPDEEVRADEELAFQRWKTDDGSLYGAYEARLLYPPQGVTRIASAFSGGRTSAVMTKLLIDEYRDKGYEVCVTFANTGCEHEATLEFVRDCDRYWGFNTVWLEGAYPADEGVRHKIVDFDSASRHGEPFEAYVAKYGIPNQITPGCSGKLKRLVQESYHKSRGRYRTKKKFNYVTATGIRADELDRTSKDVGVWHPLMDAGVTKAQVNAALRPIHWDLKLPSDAEGNCRGCWKKSDRKLWTLAITAPDAFDNFQRIEEKYGDHRLDREAPIGPDGRRHFYRGHRDTTDIKREAEENRGKFKIYKDTIQGTIWDDQLDLGGDCNESCEAY